MKLPVSAYQWALKHLLLEGDTDLFPVPFEFAAMKFQWKELGVILKNLDISNYSWKGGRRFIVPKKEMHFRSATQLDPFDSLIITAIIYKYGAIIERGRIPISENRVFSYRYNPDKNGRLYKTESSWHDFWRVSLEKARHENCKYVVITDISDYYNQIYHHVPERYFEKNKLPAGIAKCITKCLQSLTSNESTGIPVGPHFSHIIAECSLDSTDRSLLAEGHDFVRYVDDFHIFCSSKEDAEGAVFDFAQIIDAQQRLIPQNDKIQILPAKEFCSKAESMLIDRPLNKREKDILDIINKESDGDPYREITLESLDEEVFDKLSKTVIENLLGNYINQENIDFSRLGWLLRRFTQIAIPGGIDIVLDNLKQLTPIIGTLSRYLLASVPNLNDGFVEVGKKIVDSFDHPAIRKSQYLQIMLMSVLAKLPELNHVDESLASYKKADNALKREIMLVAEANGHESWIHSQKNGFNNFDPWTRRAFIFASAKLTKEESKSWLKSNSNNFSAIDKIITRYAYKNKTMKVGEIKLS